MKKTSTLVCKLFTLFTIFLLNVFAVKAQCIAPLMVWKNAVLVSGTGGQIGAEYKFPSVIAGVDAFVTVKDIVGGAALTSVDDNTFGYSEAWQPVVKTPNQLLRDRFFGEGKVGEDMNFSWVNKDNILKVYDAFFQSYKDNKGDFSREDFDETKLIYEALDSRKNTVEKEGLSAEDNTKIASIKFKFAPMFKVNRIGAKARENEEAKE